MTGPLSPIFISRLQGTERLWNTWTWAALQEASQILTSHLENQINEAVRILSDRDFLIPFFSRAEWPTTIRAVRREGKSSLKGYSAPAQKDAQEKIDFDLFLLRRII